MKPLQCTKYDVIHPLLKNLIKYFWHIESTNPVSVYHKLLPVSNIDIILNLGAPIRYKTNQVGIEPKSFHFNGIMSTHYFINQSGCLNVMGISFQFAGLYPFLKVPLDEFKNQTVDLELLVGEFVYRLEEQLYEAHTITDKLFALEKELIRLLDVDYIPDTSVYRVIHDFYSSANYLDVAGFCNLSGINQRKMERIFGKYVGISPKLFQRFIRFQGIVNEMIRHTDHNLLELTYQHNYFDQTHFIKDFKSFTGCTPSKFMEEKRTIKENMHIMIDSQRKMPTVL